MENIIDQLSWPEFIQSKKAIRPITKINEFNRLIAHSKTFLNFRLWHLPKVIF